VVVANRLPVDRTVEPGGTVSWQRSPGGLVSALAPVMTEQAGSWVGWPGAADEELDPFDAEGMRLVPVSLSWLEVAEYYEGFSNATLWPLYHDVTAPPVFDRRWWDSYVSVNDRFAAVSADEAGHGATVWVQDYQLQLVPALLRARRPDLHIGFFNHIPFPGYEIYSRLPWRRQVIEGLLGADLIGFQRRQDASNFMRAARRAAGVATRGSTVIVESPPLGDQVDGPRGWSRPGEVRHVQAMTFPISIDSKALDRMAREEPTAKKARALRSELGDPDNILLGIDRLDYTKGIRHRLEAYGELLDEGAIGPTDAVFVQVASPSRERVEEYQRLRDEVELVVGRINGEHSTLGHPAIHYLHRSFPREDLTALYLAADVMVVTPLRDGMNLIAKEYVACRFDERGALVLSEFTGAADELRQAYVLNPYDIDGTKAALMAAIQSDARERSRRMRAMRRTVFDADVYNWASKFLSALADTPGPRRVG
jgi:alpha,alpha-trehalose-phosphate synthase [UDP-forming]